MLLRTRTTDLTGFVVITMLLVFLFYLRCLWLILGIVSGFLYSWSNWILSRGGKVLTWRMNFCTQLFTEMHLSCVRGSCNSINGLCWWQKPRQESSRVTSALMWRCNTNLFTLLKAFCFFFFLIFMLSMYGTTEMPLNRWKLGVFIGGDFKAKGSN